MMVPLVGEFNVLEASFGARGMGKSTHQAYRALKLQQETGGYVIGHSLGARLPEKLPDSMGGDRLPISYHKDMASLDRGLRRHPARWHILAPPLSRSGSNREASSAMTSADSLLRYSVALSDGIRRRAWLDAHPMRMWRDNASMTGVRARPVIVVIDEGIAVESAGPTRKDDNTWFLQFLFSLRHYNIALLYSIQDSSARNWRLVGQATTIYVFATRHEWALIGLRAAGATEDEIARIRRLRKYEFVKIESVEIGGMHSVHALPHVPPSDGAVKSETEVVSVTESVQTVTVLDKQP